MMRAAARWLPALVAAASCQGAMWCADGAATAASPDGVSASAAWSRATTADARNGVVYLTLVNHGDHDVQLTAARSDACDHVEIHETSCCAGGAMAMRALAALTVPAHGQLVLKPEGDHLMLIALKHGLTRGEAVPLTLSVGGATLTVAARVCSPAAMGPSD